MSDPMRSRDTPTLPPAAPHPGGSETETVPPEAPPDASATLPPDPAAPASTGDGLSIPGYEIITTLGRGGMGVVYQARQTKLGRVVALKMILSGAHADAADLARFRTEAEAIARLQHPNIVQIHEVGDHGGLPFFSLEYCGGGSLEKKLGGTPLPPQEAAALVETLARAMQAAHDKGVIHRDLKPANVLLAEDGTPKVTDFGLAKKLDEAGQTASGAVMGTPSYMAPEQAGGKAVGPRADVYALGAILYECLTGRPPFKAATMLDTVMQVVSDEPVPPKQLQSKTPRDLETICLKCLQKEPAKRYESAAALAEELHRFQNGEPIAARPAGKIERARKWAKRRPAAAALLIVSVFAGLTVVGVVGTAALLVYGKNRELSDANVQLTDERNRARTAEEDALAKKAEAVAAKDDLEKMLARSLLRPLALQGNQPMTGPEWEALWELATNRRQGRLGYRFVEEASRGPVTSRQLKDRAALALSAAVGLDEERRAEVEQLLMARLADPALQDEQKTDLTLAAAMWDGLSRPAAGRTARQLTRAIKDTNDPKSLQLLAQVLSAVAGRLESKDAAPVAAALAQAIKDATNDGVWASLADRLTAVAACLEAEDAAPTAAALAHAMKDTKDLGALRRLASGMRALAGSLGSKDAAPVAAALAHAMKDIDDPFTLQELARALWALAGRLEPRAASAVTAPVTTALAQTAIKDARDGSVGALSSRVTGLSALAGRLVSGDAAPVAAALAQAIKDTKEPTCKGSLAQGLSALAGRLEARDAAPVAAAVAQAIKDTKDPGALMVEAGVLSALAGRLEARDAAAVTAPVAAALAQAMKDTKDPYALLRLAVGLSALAARLEPGDTASAAAAFTQAIKDTKEPYTLGQLASLLWALAGRLESRDAAPAAAALAQAMKDTKDLGVLAQLASSMTALAGRLEAKDAAPAAATLAQAIKDTKAPYALRWLAAGLSALAGRLECGDATAVAAPAAATLLQAIKDTKAPNALEWQAEGLSELARRLEPRDATTVAAPAAAALARAMKDTKDPNDLRSLALGLSALAARLEAKDAAAIAAPAVTTLIQAIKDNNNPSISNTLALGLKALVTRLEAKDVAPTASALTQAMNHGWPADASWLAQCLSALLSPGPSADLPSRSAMTATAVAAPPGAGHALPTFAFLIPAAEPLPCRLSDQQLVELLKTPPFVGEARRVVLDQLGNRHHRTFADVWEFVRFAKEQRLDLDFTTPPQRPEPAGLAAAKP